MDIEFMNAEIATFHRDALALAERKNRDYHPDGIAYLEILRTACDTGVTVEQDLWGRFNKQMSALRKYVIDGRVESEPQRGRMIDIANYMAILAVWDFYKTQIVMDARLFVELKQSCEFANEPCRQDADPTCDRCRLLWWLVRLQRKLALPDSGL